MAKRGSSLLRHRVAFRCMVHVLTMWMGAATLSEMLRAGAIGGTGNARRNECIVPWRHCEKIYRFGAPSVCIVLPLHKTRQRTHNAVVRQSNNMNSGDCVANHIAPRDAA